VSTLKQHKITDAYRTPRGVATAMSLQHQLQSNVVSTAISVGEWSSFIDLPVRHNRCASHISVGLGQ